MFTRIRIHVSQLLWFWNVFNTLRIAYIPKTIIYKENSITKLEVKDRQIKLPKIDTDVTKRLTKDRNSVKRELPAKETTFPNETNITKEPLFLRIHSYPILYLFLQRTKNHERITFGCL